MPEQPHPGDDTPDESQTSQPEPPAPAESGTVPASTTPALGAETPVEPSREPSTGTSRPGGKRVTHRTVDRRETTSYTEETITEDIPLEAYQGPSSTHPAPVG